jgi:hypothetical protein
MHAEHFAGKQQEREKERKIQKQKPTLLNKLCEHGLKTDTDRCLSNALYAALQMFYYCYYCIFL